MRCRIIASMHGSPTPTCWARLVRYAIMLFVVMIALSQVEVGGDIVQRTFLIILAGLMLALAPWHSVWAARNGRRRCCSAGGRSIERTRSLIGC